MSTMETTELQRTIDQLRHGVGTPRSCYGDVPAVRRLRNDIERPKIDPSEPTTASVAPAPRGQTDHVVVVVPGTPYDPDLWRGADDEGVGGYRH